MALWGRITRFAREKGHLTACGDRSYERQGEDLRGARLSQEAAANLRNAGARVVAVFFVARQVRLFAELFAIRQTQWAEIASEQLPQA